MNRKLPVTGRFSRLIFSTILLCLGGTRHVYADMVDEIIISPPNPTIYDDIQLYVRGVTGGCTPMEPQVSVSDKVIYVNFTQPSANAECAYVESIWSEHVPIFQANIDRSLGEYQVIISWEGYGELARTSFAITSKKDIGGLNTGMTTRRIVCKNMTTGKRKVIESNAGTWNCEAAGLKVKPGDKVWMTVKGVANTAP